LAHVAVGQTNNTETRQHRMIITAETIIPEMLQCVITVSAATQEMHK
jgi:hypothetical protein